MSRDTDRKIYGMAMVRNAFEKLYSKETNAIDVVSDAQGLELTATATCDDTHRYITITVGIKKED